jgi:hypothetical protein
MVPFVMTVNGLEGNRYDPHQILDEDGNSSNNSSSNNKN